MLDLRNPQPLLAQLCTIAAEAGGAILEVYGRDFAVHYKDDRSPLTEADEVSQRIIVERLHALDDSVPVLSEESAPPEPATRRSWARFWLVDPLDGTKEFLKRNGEFTVNIALIEGHRPVLGVVQTPVGGELACAWRGGGAWIARPGEKARHVKTRKRATPIVVAGSRSHASAHESELLARLGHCAKMPLGSSLKFLRIAAAEADLYIRLGPTSEWDTGAGQCVLEEAGGVVLDMKGEPLRYNTRDSLLNPDFVAIGDPSADWSALFAGL